jgi:hypothetical protein
MNGDSDGGTESSPTGLHDQMFAPYTALSIVPGQNLIPPAINEDDENPDENVVQEIGWQKIINLRNRPSSSVPSVTSLKVQMPAAAAAPFAGTRASKKSKIYVYQNTGRRTIPSGSQSSNWSSNRKPDFKPTDDDAKDRDEAVEPNV